ncbi:MAG: glycoside hydrolase family 15 protein [Hyphomicrobiales bacterium]|nr:glycoside hydrolase family 15 protein [Hyphomicrobiales bacterium]
MTDAFEEPARRYAPIRDYAAVGDGHGSALVSRSGSVDWCCLQRFDADPIFCRLLDADRGGFFSIDPALPFTADRSYLDGTNILQTTFSTPVGAASVTDFMPVGRRPRVAAHDYVHLNAPNWLVRIVDGRRGKVDLRIRYRPSIDFARRRPALRQGEAHIEADSGACLYHDGITFDVEGDLASAIVEVGAGERLVLVVTPQQSRQQSPVEAVPRLLEITTAYWQEWIAYCRYEGPYGDAVRRSALALKLLAFAPTGAIAAAPTTSLPEEIGGVRNWDYRYCWLRDATFTLYALAAVGYGGEARKFSAFLPWVCSATHPELQVMYGIGGEAELVEQTLDHLDGYEGSRPVRTGNGAYDQSQIDIFGEVLDWALLYRALAGRFDRREAKMLAALADFVADHWEEPDHGLWEVRGPPQGFVHGKMMSWVALDRAIRLFGSRPSWEKERGRIVDVVKEHGIDPSDGHLLQFYGASGTDAALLLAPMVAFPIEGATLEATVAAVERELRHGDFVYRYDSDDGLVGEEGAFLICSFWLVDALLQIGKDREANELFERLLDRANDVGLYAEEIDPTTGDFLGNFPQAFTHLALISAAVNLDLYTRRGLSAIVGSHADRARDTIGATLGWRGIWAAFKATKRLGRIISSRASILPPDLCG